MMKTVEYQCPAKINLALSVGPPREDGFHPIISWMIAIDLFDDLTIQQAEKPSFDIQWADDAPCPSEIDWPLPSDLVYQAWKRLEAEVGRALPIQLTLRKRIPVGGGLAGGSSDAVFTLLAVNELYELNLSEQILIDIANQLGSDLSFFFKRPSALLTGRGDHVQTAPYPHPVYMTMIFPDFGCPTGAVYRAFDDRAAEARLNTDGVHALLQQTKLTAESPFNDLAEAACRVRPELAKLRADIGASIARKVHVTGSGACMFALWDTPEEAAVAAEHIQAQFKVKSRGSRYLNEL